MGRFDYINLIIRVDFYTTIFILAILQSPCTCVRPSVHTFVKDVSAATGRNDFIFDT